MNTDLFLSSIMELTNPLFRFAYWRTGNREDAEDAVQDTFMKLWKMRNRFYDYEKLDALAFKILRNLCIDRKRKRKMICTDLLGYKNQLFDNLTPERIIEFKEEINRVREAASNLPEQQQTIFFLKSIHGYEIKEIADLMNIKRNTVEVNLSRARKKLHIYLSH